MEGSVVASTSESGNTDKSLIPMPNRWEVEYGHFFNFPTSVISTHPSLIPMRPSRKHNLKGTWISSFSPTASLQLLHDHSLNDSILTVTFRHKTLEKHYVSKLHVTWPQVSCMSGYPARGSRVVLLSYKDHLGQIQKFALRFLTIYESEKFTNCLKEVLEDVRVYGLPCGNFGSEISFQSEFVPSNETVYRPREDFSPLTSTDTCAHPLPLSLNCEVAQDYHPKETTLNHDVEGIFPDFPPSFTSFMKNCCPEVERATAQPTGPQEVDLKAEIARYLEDSSFQDMLSKVQKVISEMGDDLIL